MSDIMSSAARSALMAKVRSKGNKRTEVYVEECLTRLLIGGWVKHAKIGRSQPDFYFPQQGVAVFIDGCFWHGCPKCGKVPATNSEFWERKIAENKERDKRHRKQLQVEGLIVVSIWQHELKRGNTAWLRRLRAALKRASKT